MIAENNIKDEGIVNAIGNSLLEFILVGKIPFSAKSYYKVKTQSEHSWLQDLLLLKNETICK